MALGSVIGSFLPRTKNPSPLRRGEVGLFTIAISCPFATQTSTTACPLLRATNRDRMDFLKSAVASAIAKGPPFPYTFGDRVDLDASIWTLHNGTKRV